MPACGTCAAAVTGVVDGPREVREGVSVIGVITAGGGAGRLPAGRRSRRSSHGRGGRPRGRPLLAARRAAVSRRPEGPGGRGTGTIVVVDLERGGFELRLGWLKQDIRRIIMIVQYRLPVHSNL